MTQDDIIRMAKEADLWMTSDERIAAVKRFAELVVAHEREACAKVADEYTHGVRPDISAAIRARGQA